MLRRTLAGAAALAMVLGVLAISPAQAEHNGSNVYAHVSGGVNIDGSPCTTSNGEAGTRNSFTGVEITGLFTTASNSYLGAVTIENPGVVTCGVDDRLLGPVPVLGHGTLASANFKTLAGDVGTDTENDNAPVCLEGTLAGGHYRNTGVVLSRAFIKVGWVILAPGADDTCAVPGAVIERSAGWHLVDHDNNPDTPKVWRVNPATAPELEADVFVVPGGAVLDNAFGDSFGVPDVVSAQVQTAHVCDNVDVPNCEETYNFDTAVQDVNDALPF